MILEPLQSILVLILNQPTNDLNPVLYDGTFFCSPVIGRGGEQINRIQLESGCKIQIAAGEPGFVTCFWCESTCSDGILCLCRQWWSDGAAMFSDRNSREY